MAAGGFPAIPHLNPVYNLNPGWLLAASVFGMPKRGRSWGTEGVQSKRRKYTRYGRAGTSRRYRRRSKTTGVYANPRIGGFLGTELKFYDQSLEAGALTAPTNATGGEHDPSSTVMIMSVGQGDGETNRDGRSIVMMSIGLKGMVRIPRAIDQTVLKDTCIVFIALVLDTQTNATQINSEDVYLNKSADANLATMPFRNLENSRRFTVLKTRTLSIGHPQVSWDGTNIEQAGMTRRWDMFVNLNKMKVNFKGTTQTIANITDNSLHVIAWCSNVDLAPVLYYNSRLRFVG